MGRVEGEGLVGKEEEEYEEEEWIGVIGPCLEAGAQGSSASRVHRYTMINQSGPASSPGAPVHYEQTVRPCLEAGAEGVQGVAARQTAAVLVPVAAPQVGTQSKV